MKQPARAKLTRVAAAACCAIYAMAAQPSIAAEQATSIRILSSRNAGVESASSGVSFEAASGAQRDVAPAKVSESPTRTSRIPTAAAAKNVISKTGPAKAAEMAARKAGVPQRKAHNTVAPPGIGGAASSPTAMGGKARVTRDPLSPEMVREGGNYYFNGWLNGNRVRFRLNEEMAGVNIPSHMAEEAKVLPAAYKKASLKGDVVLVPVGSMSFGAYPVRSLLAKIYVAPNETVIDIGRDALATFRVREIDGRKMLVKS